MALPQLGHPKFLEKCAVQLDVTDATSIAACKARVATITGTAKPDIVVNNA